MRGARDPGHYLNLDGRHPERGSLDAWGTVIALCVSLRDDLDAVSLAGESSRRGSWSRLTGKGDKLAGMAYTNAEARGQLLADLAGAADQLALALACLGTAYEQLDEQRADELEQLLFHPVQLAYGRAQRTHAEFARRHGLAPRTFSSPSAGPESQGAVALIERAGDAAGDAEQAIAELQDSMLPVEVGDPELRAGLSEVRELVSHVPARAHELVRSVGR